MAPQSTTANGQSRKLVMSFEVPAGSAGASSAGKSKTEEKAHGQGAKQGFVVQVSGSAEAGFDQATGKRADGPPGSSGHVAPIELTSKLEGSADITGDGLVNYEHGGAPPGSGSGVMTVATIKPAQK